MPRLPVLASATVLMLASAPAFAGQDRPLTDREPDAVDVAKTPTTDLNLTKQEIPQLLLRARNDPYEAAGSSCRDIMAGILALDEYLGPDLDLPQEERDRITAGRAAKAVVGHLIPFRGLIREVSGANKHEQQLDAAIQAGLMRRSYLKGVGQQKGCKYPARPATPEAIAAYQTQLERQRSDDDDKDKGRPAAQANTGSAPVAQR